MASTAVKISSTTAAAAIPPEGNSPRGSQVPPAQVDHNADADHGKRHHEDQKQPQNAHLVIKNADRGEVEVLSRDMEQRLILCKPSRGLNQKIPVGQAARGSRSSP